MDKTISKPQLVQYLRVHPKGVSYVERGVFIFNFNPLLS
jgi:hypothetical protein